ncbi:VOC family protein [Pseudomonas sp. BN102]|nr:VOC family protein [Pseudomonas sp. BN102]
MDSLYQRLLTAGVDFYTPLADRDFGMRDFSVQDPDGNQIGMGATLNHQP